ncbi:hypothetical protein R6Q57_004015 [Mikania cordata]
MERFLLDIDVRPKHHSSDETLRKWRDAISVIKRHHRRRFRFTADLEKIVKNFVGKRPTHPIEGCGLNDARPGLSSGFVCEPKGFLRGKRSYDRERSKAALKKWRFAISRVKDRVRRLRNLPELKKTYGELDHLEIRLEKVVSATNNFANENLIKEGEFGKDYKGQMLGSGQLIDICARRLKRKYGQEDIEFWTEISMLSSLKHKNIISLVGFCDEADEKIIIYEHAVHGSLDRHLSDPTLTWFQRLQICLGVARALSYIHYDVIHCDINSYKIFLDHDWEPRIYGFEHSTKYPQSWRHRLLFSRYFDDTNMTPKYDVYSFGVLLFEVICGRKPVIETHRIKEEVDDIIHPTLRKQMDTQSLAVFTKITYNCLNQQLVQRPTMDQIVKELEDVLELQWKHENLEHSTVADEGTSLNSLKLEWLRIPLSEIRSATNNFDETYSIGFGGFGIVYKATLNVLDIQNLSSMEGKCKDELPRKSKTVAIKRIFDRQDEQGKQGFLTEIELLTSCKHPNIVSLLGFSREGREMILVYEFAFKGSLNDYFENNRKHINLNWAQRIQICLDIAQGINYLHTSMDDKPRIIHRDIKSENILLDENLSAKVADFGLSKFHPTNQQVSTIYTKNIAGTEVYMDPEYMATFKYKKESDIYSFGVVLFEILSGRLAYDSIYIVENDKGLAPIARRHFNEGTIKELIDPKITEEDDEQIVTLNRGPNQDSLEAFSRIAYHCLAETQAKRPKMEAVIRELQKALNLQGETIVLSRFRLNDILLATKNFSETYCIGFHPYGKVYKAKIDNSNNSLLAFVEKNDCILPETHNNVAIKRIFRKASMQGKQGFFLEIEMRTHYKHPNIVSLLGFCDEGDEMILVFEHASNNSLDDYLKNVDRMNNLTWTQRLQMCLGIAHGLDHLHTKMDNQQRVIHGDIRSTNIVLGKNRVPKIAYFGIFMSHLTDEEASNPICSKVYMDPEIEKIRIINKESDIYSFGVVLFEIFCGRLAYDPIYIVENDEGLAPIARHHFNDGTIKKMMDPKLKELSNEDVFTSNKGPNQDSLDTFLKIAYHCLGETRAKRPPMNFIIKELEIALNFQENLMKSLQISLEDIKLATKNFSQKNLYGSGRYWEAYKGELPHATTTSTIVAKRWYRMFDDHFWTKLDVLTKVKHKNILGLVGYCTEMDEKIIVYEHMSKGSLDNYLKDPNLKWMKRLQICIDVASALEFLYRGDVTPKTMYRNIKSHDILLNDDWNAKISAFELSALHSLHLDTEHINNDAYLDPLYKQGFLTKKSHIYSFGVVLFEILCGILAWVHGGEDNNHALGSLAKHYYVEGKLDEMVFEDIREQIVPQSLTTFGDIAYQCLHEDDDKRPQESEVVIQLWKALEYQEDSEIWEPKLPRNYREIISLSDSTEIYHTQKKKDIYKKLCNGILFPKEKVWFILTDNGGANKMISAMMFSYENQKQHKWRSIHKSRFGTVAKMLDISNIKIQITTNTQFLSPDVVYAVYLVFKFCDPRIFSCKRMYMNLKYRNETETLNSYFATWRDDEWMMIELYRFLNHEDVTFKFLLDSFSRYYCRSDAIYIEGIEFRAIKKVVPEDIEDLKEVQQLKKSNSDLDHLHQSPTLNEEIFKRSENEDMVEQLFSLSELNGKKHLMLSALKVLYNSPKLNPFCFKSSADSRFKDVVELLPQQVFRIKYKIESQMLSPFTEYTCYLVFKVSEKCQGLRCPVKVRDLFFSKNKENRIIYFRSPAPLNLHDGFWVPGQRKDGWMELFYWALDLEIHGLVKPIPATSVLDIQVQQGVLLLLMSSATITKFAHLQIPLEDVANATNNFHHDNIIGHGGFGTAYRGRLLRSGNEFKIAARRLDRKHGEGDVEFWTEVSMLSDLNHPNLVSIIGFCDENDEKIIVSTYESNGSLEKHLNSLDLTWAQRLRICVGVARALSYLHYDQGRGYGVIHRNVNSYTILLDENWEAKLSGFEISMKQSVNQMERVLVTEPIGTIGYMDPAVEKTRGVTHKSDIYSFGVVLFEMLCGRKAFVRNEEAAKRFLAPLAKYHYKNKSLQDIIHPDLWNQMSPQSLVKCSKAAFFCLKEEQTHRPDMDKIVVQLEKALELQLLRENFDKNLKCNKIPLSDIKFITDNFSETCSIGSFRFYSLYRINIKYLDKENSSCIEGNSNVETPAIIKRILPRDDEEGEKAFYAELEALASIKHRNIVALIGSCVEASEMIFIIETGYRNLSFYLTKEVNIMDILTWEKRLKICIDVAHALNYLHSEMEEQKMIINRDVNSYNIGLDENMRAKIVEFGLSIILPQNQADDDIYVNRVFGLKDYMDPEYEKCHKVKKASDVYSFGVVLFEILFGRLADDPIYLNGVNNGLACVARRSFRMGTIDEMIDPIIKEETDENHFVLDNKDSLHTFIEIAFQCVAETQDQRPTMKVVVQELEKALFYKEDLGPNIAQIVNGLENGLELQWPDEMISDERIQRPSKEQVVHELEQSLELQTRITFKHLEHLKIHLNDITLATDNFSEAYKIGFGDYCALYRAELNHFHKGNPSYEEGKNKDEHRKRHDNVVIKRILPRDDDKGKKVFYTEIEVLARVEHRNIVNLLGFCIEGSEMILVTEDVSNGYLIDYLSNINELRILSWEKRLKICIDVAHALVYLHSKMEDKKMIIINRDINSYNIGLDENWGAKIVEFGSSIFLSPDQEDGALFSSYVGKPSYIDPEYKMNGKLKTKSDVYSFGVVLFEILCGRLANDPIYKKESDKGLAQVARHSFCMGTLEDMIDPVLREETSEHNFVLNRGPNKDSLRTYRMIALHCVAETQYERPTMEIVVKRLEKALCFQKNNKDNPTLSIEDINQATQNFHNDNCIGGGGFGRVFKGTIQDGDRFKTIVAKRLDTRLGQGEKQFLSELQILLEYKHENVIGLVGYCDEKDEKIIVYEYASRGSLDRYLTDASLTWVKRLDICIDVARALDFLHGGVGKQAKVIHRDIKTANILLNHDWKAKLADFGLSLISPLIQETDYVIDHACGTQGYVDPLYRKSGFLTTESDIYSFGVVLFEILCGRSTFAIKKHEGRYLPEFIKYKFEEGKHDEVTFKQIREQIVPKSLATFQEIAYQCLHLEREKRPATKRVLSQLKRALEFQNMASTMTKFAPLQIPLEDVVAATNNFHDDSIIGHSGFGIAYKGELLRSGRLTKIVARRFDCKHEEGDLKFLTEMSVLSDLKHKNLVSLIGFCDEKDEKIIITTYEANGSLGQYLNSPYLTWGQILRVLVGVAHALSYLRYDEGRDYAIIHCNINSDTILLDENWEAKLSGFENSIKQLVCYKEEVTLCEHIGTMGYLDPAFENTGGVTHKSDIYSFGVVLLEIICRRKAYIENENEDNRFLAPLVKYHYENKTFGDILNLNPYWYLISPHSFHKYLNIAFSCLNEERGLRPGNNYIVDELENAMELQLQLENIENNLEHLKIRLSDIESATNNFSEAYEISSNIYYTWYRGELECYDEENLPSMEKKTEGELFKRCSTVLIKRILLKDDEEREQAFYTEIDMLTSVKHQNIAPLVGFCVEESEMVLVIENASNGFLTDYLKNANDTHRILTWEKRLKICIDVAHALKYLHYEMEDQKMIINRDICSYNIALDENWGTKIVNFESAIYLPPNQEDEALHVSSWTGKLHYMDPEYKMTGKLKKESDVYSFGVVLLEILCGRLADDPIYLEESYKGLAHVARESFCMGTLEDMIDPIIKEEIGENRFILNKRSNNDSLHIFIEIALQCVVETQDQRPSMKVVVQELEKALLFQVSRCSKNIYTFS